MKTDKRTGKKPRAAILTWCGNHGPVNYGQVLQCYAMQCIAEEKGYDPIVIQYREKEPKEIFSRNFSNTSLWGRFLNNINESYFLRNNIAGGRTKRAKNFRRFIRKNIALSPPCYTKKMVEEMTADCRILICGSDQIWNPIWFDPVLFLDFGAKGQKRIAYAASGIFLEKPEFEDTYRHMAALIEHLDHVSVREKVGADILKKYVKKKIVVQEDPTLCLGQEKWERASAGRLIKEEYIFCYLLGSLSPYQLILRKIKEKYRAEKIICIPSNLFLQGVFREVEVYEDAGPAQFLSLIRFAKAVCTDSFHGVAISMQYHVPFYNVYRNQKGTDEFGGRERIENLLGRKGLEIRWIKNAGDVVMQEGKQRDGK